MPGKQVKNWSMYEALRSEGKSKESAARITNSKARKRGGRGRSGRAGTTKRSR